MVYFLLSSSLLQKFWKLQKIMKIKITQNMHKCVCGTWWYIYCVYFFGNSFPLKTSKYIVFIFIRKSVVRVCLVVVYAKVVCVLAKRKLSSRVRKYFYNHKCVAQLCSRKENNAKLSKISEVFFFQVCGYSTHKNVLLNKTSATGL